MGKRGSSWKCETCNFELYLPVHAPGLTVTHAGLYSDSRFPGRCLLAFDEHVEHMDALRAEQLRQFWVDAAKLGAAIRAATGADRINYAVLGNAQPHLHVHLIPRLSHEEPLPSRPPWNDPRDLQELDSSKLAELRSVLERALS